MSHRNQFPEDNMAALARAAGISPNTVRARVRSGMTVDQAISTARRRQPPRATLDLAIQHRINQHTLQYRLGTGMTLEQALATPVDESRSRKVPRAQVIAEEWGKPPIEVVRELLAEKKSQRAIAGILGACLNWTRDLIKQIEQETNQRGSSHARPHLGPDDHRNDPLPACSEEPARRAKGRSRCQPSTGIRRSSPGIHGPDTQAR